MAGEEAPSTEKAEVEAPEAAPEKASDDAPSPAAPDEESPAEPADPAPADPAPADAAPPAAETAEAPKSEQTTAPTSSAAVPASAASGYKPGYVFLVVVTLVNLVADLWSKWWAKSHFEAVRPRGERKVVIIEDVMNFIFAKNRGGAWGLLQDETEALRRPFFLIVSVAAIVFIVSLYRKLQPGQTALKWGLPLVLGGALGNLVDRIRYGYVVDFIDIYMTMDGKVRHWPTFNVADISICVGVGLMAIDMFTSRHPDEKKKPSEAKSLPKPSDTAAAGSDASSAG